MLVVMPSRFDDIYDDVPESDPDPVRLKQHIECERIRDSSEYKRQRTLFRRDCQYAKQPDGSVGEPCSICNDQIDYKLQWPSPHCWTLHHEIAVSIRPDLILDVRNWRASHWSCNKTLGASEYVGSLQHLMGVPSEDW